MAQILSLWDLLSNSTHFWGSIKLCLPSWKRLFSCRLRRCRLFRFRFSRTIPFIIHHLPHLVYQITFSMASWIVCYGFMITCSIMAVASEWEHFNTVILCWSYVVLTFFICCIIWCNKWVYYNCISVCSSYLIISNIWESN